ncbi:hypothetical protein HCA44_14185 [Rhodococcus sp. HNM0569]|nr:hypothetical protein [Rhodococcus sp. HNM0569]
MAARRTAATLAIGIAAAASTAATATAAPAENPGESTAVTDLWAQAHEPQQRDAIEALATSPVLADVAGEFTPFLYTAPTVGCGTFAPVTMTMASATTGPSAEVRAREINFQALSAYPGVVSRSGLNVAWLNTATGASGIAPLDGTTVGGYPSLSKVVETGAGTVVASIFGSVDYTNATCHVLPTVGAFLVPDEGPLPSETAPTPPPADAAPPADTAPPADDAVAPPA